MILEGECFYYGDFGHVTRAWPNKRPYRYQLHRIKAHIAPFQLNISTTQIAPMVVNTEDVHLTLPCSKRAEI
jgi:hypothetical protein